MSLSRLKGKQIVTESVILPPGNSPLELSTYTVSATGSGKQLLNLDYVDTLPIGSATQSLQSLQDTTDIGSTSSNDIIITDFTRGLIMTSPDLCRWRVTINDRGQLLTTKLSIDTLTNMTFDTGLPGVSSNNQIQLPLLNDTTDMYVDWGDGGPVENITSYTNNTHTYSTSGSKSITIYGTYSWSFDGSGDNTKLTNINSWGDFVLRTGAFNGCINLNDILSTDTPSVDPILSRSFKNCNNIVVIDNINSWDMSGVTHLDQFLFGATSFNHTFAINTTSNLTTTSRMFFGCIGFNNNGSPLSFDISGVTIADYMFYNCQNFNQNINGLDFGNTIILNHIFYNCVNFNNGDSGDNSSEPMTLSTPLATNASYAFALCTSFNQDLNNWDVSSMVTLESTFNNCFIYNKPMNLWNTSNLEVTHSMFRNNYDLNQDLNDWVTSKLDISIAMFFDASSFNNGDVFRGSSNPLSWETSSFRLINSMFHNTPAFNQELRDSNGVGKWDMSNVTSIYNMFINSGFNQYVGDWDLTNASSMNAMFNDCQYFNNGESPGSSSAPIQWVNGSQGSLRSTFQDAISFNQKFRNVSDTGVMDFTVFNDMRDTFNGASVYNQPMDDWDVSNVSNMDNFGLNTSISTDNYTDMLDSWSQLNLRINVPLGMGSIQYYSSAQGSRDLMTGTPSSYSSPFGWVITDGGPIGSGDELGWTDGDVMGWTNGDSVGI